ncbi:MAG: pyruvate kinase [Lachnospiraceae bacterium]|nr:pyruvate kinase [Lachnospiraceae bacterium]
MRKTKIICTIGPASESEEQLRKLVVAGMNVARFNFSHGTHEEHEEKFRRFRKIRVDMNVPIASLLDTRGPEIRLRNFKTGKVELETGQRFTLTSRDLDGDSTIASITYPGLVRDVRKGAHILIDDGLIGLIVENVTDTDIVCTVENGGSVSNHKGINVPDAELSMPFISDSDRADIEFGCRMGYDIIACSFTRTAEDIREVRKILDAHESRMLVIAKIENMQGVSNAESILDTADGIMVARGDLGVEVPLEEVPSIQKKLIRLAKKKGKIVITATQMLDSMMHNPRPTRAETTDVANAIYDGTSAIMLSGETAAGKYPVEAVKVMSRIAERAERDIDSVRGTDAFSSMIPAENVPDSGDRLKTGSFAIPAGGLEKKHSVTTASICHASCVVASEIGAAAIVTVSISGFTAKQLSRLHPQQPIISCSTNVRVACQSNLLYGVVPLIIGLEEEETKLFETAITRARMTGLVKSGERVVLVAGVPLGASGNTNMVRVLEVQ